MQPPVAPSGDCESHIVNYAIIKIRQAAAQLSPSGGTTFQTTFPRYRLVKVS